VLPTRIKEALITCLVEMGHLLYGAETRPATAVVPVTAPRAALKTKGALALLEDGP
jgi:hypothetical protein